MKRGRARGPMWKEVMKRVWVPRWEEEMKRGKSKRSKIGKVKMNRIREGGRVPREKGGREGGCGGRALRSKIGIIKRKERGCLCEGMTRGRVPRGEGEREGVRGEGEREGT